MRIRPVYLLPFYSFLLFSILFFSCIKKQGDTRFLLLEATDIGIDFNNEIIESDSINMLEFTNIYNGAGVGVGDFNNDNKPDIYFCGSTVTSRLYLNRTSGDGIYFEDVTEASGVATSRWATGVSIVDLNFDGWQDIYVCVSGSNDRSKRRNYLFMNQGNDENGIPAFIELASEYGIADETYSSQAIFFDYDKDSDLDLMIAVNYPENFYGSSMNKLRTPLVQVSERTDRLYENLGFDEFSHLKFQDVSAKAGILYEGYSLGISAMDINEDGWVDVYLSNDFLTNDIIYVNNQDGTFTNKIDKYFKHTTFAGMGQDIADYNNDGLLDILVLDMLPSDNERLKRMLKSTDYDIYKIREKLGYYPQFNRNTLQLNNGMKPNGDLSFSEIGRFANIHQTDWSWAAIFSDFNNDGWKDIFVTNGYRKDMQDQDAIMDMFEKFNPSTPGSLEELRYKIEDAPEVYVPNKMYENQRDLTFVERTYDWTNSARSFSSGAVVLDIDNDGDQDIVVSNLNEPPYICVNQTLEITAENQESNYLKLRFSDNLKKNQLFGTRIEIHHGETHQYIQYHPVHGYLSSFYGDIHFGLGPDTIVNISVQFPNDAYMNLTEISANQTLVLNMTQIDSGLIKQKEIPLSKNYFAPVSERIKPSFKHEESDVNDFEVQPLVRRKYSQMGPGIAIGDVDSDGLDDFFIGGALGQSGAIYKQTREGNFVVNSYIPTEKNEDMGCLFFDADQDGDLDLYVSSGGVEFNDLNKRYLDRLFVNDGKGNYNLDTVALPLINTSSFNVNASDYDSDGDLDLFIGGRIDLKNYPESPGNYILRNESQDRKPKFIDVTDEIASGISNIGLVSSSLWSDFDNDGKIDLILVGEWMPITFFKNLNGQFCNVTDSIGETALYGWWQSINGGDFDKDGDVDYVVGNLGLNSFYRASLEKPIELIVEDFDNNGIKDPLMFAFKFDQQFPVHSRDQIINQMPTYSTLFPTHKSYAKATINDFVHEGSATKSKIMYANELRSIYLENMGGGKIKKFVLNKKIQISPINDIVIRDFDNDGKLDMIMAGNNHSINYTQGPIDASIGYFLKGKGNGQFSVLNGLESGILMDYDARATSIISGGDKLYILSSANDEKLRLFQSTKKYKDFIRLKANESHAKISYHDGEVEKREFYYAKGYLSASSRILVLNKHMKNIKIFNFDNRISRQFSF
jgi:hypothetical protein